MSIRAGARRPFWRALLRVDVLAALDAVNARFSGCRPGRHRCCRPDTRLWARVDVGTPPRSDLEFFLRAGVCLYRHGALAYTQLECGTVCGAGFGGGGRVFPGRGGPGADARVGLVPVPQRHVGYLRHDPAGHLRFVYFWCFWANTSSCLLP